MKQSFLDVTGGAGLLYLELGKQITVALCLEKISGMQ